MSPPACVALTFDRLTLKLVCESHLRWGTFISNLGTLGFWVLELFAMYATDGQPDRWTDRRQTDGQKQRLFPPSLRSGHNNDENCNINGAIPKRPIAKTAPTKTAPKILMPKKLSKTAHSYMQNGPLSLSAFANVQSDLEILYAEASYTRVRGLDDCETVKCSAMHYGVTCSKFKSVNGSRPIKIATQHFPHKSHTNLIMNPTYD